MSSLSPHDFDASLIDNGSELYSISSGRNILENIFSNYAVKLSGERCNYIHRCCPFCSGDDNTLIFDKYNVYITRCTLCKFVYVSDFPSISIETHDGSTFLDEMDGAHLQFIESDTYRHYAELRYQYALSIVEKYRGIDGKSLLDIGCSTGQMLVEANKKGWQVFGVEVSREAAIIAKKKFDNIINALYEPGQFDIKKFAVVTSFDVLEHVPNPVEFLQSMSQSLIPGGILLVQVPNAGSLSARLKKEKDNIFNGLIHLNYFTPTSLSQMAERAGLKMLHMETILSESTVLRHYSSEEIEKVLISLELDPETQLSPDMILSAGLGYKILGLFSI